MNSLYISIRLIFTLLFFLKMQKFEFNIHLNDKSSSVHVTAEQHGL